MANIPECPPSLKPIQHYLKTAAEHDARDPVVAYWCRLHALQVGLKLTQKKTPEETKVLMALMDWLEETKKEQKDNEAISNEVAAQAHLENYALKLFLYADKQDREQNYGKNVVKAFYTAGMIYDVLTTFGELTDEATQNRKYAKWKAAYIHNCLKNGETPVPGPMPTEDSQSEDTPADSTPESHPQAPGFLPVNPTLPSVPSSLPSVPTSFPSVPSSFNNSLPDANTAMRAASQLPPVPYTPDPNPGGFVPYDPSQQPIPAQTPVYTSSSVAQLTPEQITKAQKYCKFANSALNYDDVQTAITNLRNALELLQTGRDPA
ncbi:vacuolar protein sorting-associated protein VTA1 homolog [Plodia interpunctella]|uniref:vacuolar protein sorting-associated protein VTA1 homolog n=1 Tax=Plodia interpunctella TaxID=58824 RepID=UPI002367A097|nr:vacuolar protein sorting-associated protein VTA1 homolog [Plodia interpunctella]